MHLSATAATRCFQLANRSQPIHAPIETTKPLLSLSSSSGNRILNRTTEFI